MKLKIIIASIVIIGALVFGAISFVQTNVEYTNFRTAVSAHKKVQVKGEGIKEKEASYDPGRNEFVFYMKDDNGREEKIVFNGARPNNFELANAIVVKGRYQDGQFRASDILTKCPSKYEGDAETVKKTL